MFLCSSIGDESICRGVFDEYVAQLKEQAKEVVRKRKEEKVKNNQFLGIVYTFVH